MCVHRASACAATVSIRPLFLSSCVVRVCLSATPPRIHACGLDIAGKPGLDSRTLSSFPWRAMTTACVPRGGMHSTVVCVCVCVQAVRALCRFSMAAGVPADGCSAEQRRKRAQHDKSRRDGGPWSLAAPSRRRTQRTPPRPSHMRHAYNALIRRACLVRDMQVARRLDAVARTDAGQRRTIEVTRLSAIRRRCMCAHVRRWM